MVKKGTGKSRTLMFCSCFACNRVIIQHKGHWVDLSVARSCTVQEAEIVHTDVCCFVHVSHRCTRTGTGVHPGREWRTGKGRKIACPGSLLLAVFCSVPPCVPFYVPVLIRWSLVRRLLLMCDGGDFLLPAGWRDRFSLVWCGRPTLTSLSDALFTTRACTSSSCRYGIAFFSLACCPCGPCLSRC
jgi:hypothetical protein